MTLSSSLSLSFTRLGSRSPYVLLTGLGPDGARMPLFCALGDGLLYALFGKAL